MKKNFVSDFKEKSIKIFDNYLFDNDNYNYPKEFFKTFDFVKDFDYNELNNLFKGKYAVYQLGFSWTSVNSPEKTNFGKIKKFTKDGDIILKGKKRFSTRFIMNIVDTEEEAKLLCEVME